MQHPLSLRALMAHPSNGGLRRLSLEGGPEPADVPLHDVALVTSVAELAAAGEAPGTPGSLVVFTQPAPAEPWEADALLRRVKARGHRAVAFREPLALGPGTQAVARRLGLLLLGAGNPLELARAAWELQGNQDALTLGYVHRVAQSIEYHADHVQDLLRHLAASVGHGVALVDREGVLLEAGRSLSPELHARLASDAWAHAAGAGGASGASVRVESPSREGLRLVIFDHGLAGPQLSALTVAAEMAMPAVAARLLIDEVASVNNASIDSGLIRDFLEQPGGPDSDVRRRMHERGWRTSGVHVGFRILGLSRLTPLELLRSVSRETGAWDVDSHATTAGLGVIGWLTFPDPPSSREVERHAGALRELHRSLRRSFNVSTGVGTPEPGAEGLAASLDAAGEAARVAAHRERGGYFLRIDALGLEQLLLSRTRNDTFLPAARSLLQPLIDAGGDLLPTLGAYLDHESSTAATAQALGFHRNTVSTRIERIKDLLGLDFADPDTRLAVHLALRALQD
ncbi:PucR family transcriptional regulator [Galactobacter valiniphilus]|uniref:PucR family transcriptional regulator n=1 Tax=Galactobacter valiniphilus TaxID=2676122 RepID=UPI003736E0F0